MTARTEPEALVRALGEERVPLEDAAVAAERREKLLPALAGAIREVPARQERRQRIRRWAGLCAAAASIVLVGGFAYASFAARGADVVAHAPAKEPAIASLRSVTGTVVVTHGGGARVIAVSNNSLVAGDDVETAGDGAAFMQTERSAIQVSAATHVSLLPPSVAEERIRLALGRVDLKVSKQPKSPRSVVVETPNAEVVVRGTEFTVTVGAEKATPVTRVRVTEGTVWVLHGGGREILSVGDEWSSNSGRVGSAAQAAPAAPAAETAVAPTVPAARAAAPNRARSASGTLSEENALYTSALEARNRGDDKRALELFNTLLSRYPSSQLTELAQVERMRAFKRSGDRAAAAAEARRYLAEHPSGSVRDEARGLVLGE